MILKNGILPVNTLDAPKLDIVESLVEANLLKWRSGKEIKRDMGKDHDYVEVQALNDHPLAVFSRGDAELIWASPLLGRVLEAWFFQE